MTNTPMQTAARGTRHGYGSPMTAEPPAIPPALHDDLIAACKDLQAAERAVTKARATRDTAIVRLSKAGMSDPEIARTLTDAGYAISSSGVRYIVRGAR